MNAGGPPPGAPPGGYGPPQPPGQAPQGYAPQPGAPQHGYGAPQQPAFGGPQPGYAPPGQPPYAPPQPGYGAPNMGAPPSPQAPPPGGYGHPAVGPHAFGPAYAPAPLAIGPYGVTARPRCNSPHITRPTFTWWGGLLGPKLFNHTVCSGCGFGFNGKTGRSNATAIGVYLGIAVALSLLFVILRIAAG